MPSSRLINSPLRTPPRPPTRRSSSPFPTEKSPEDPFNADKSALLCTAARPLRRSRSSRDQPFPTTATAVSVNSVDTPVLSAFISEPKEKFRGLVPAIALQMAQPVRGVSLDAVLMGDARDVELDEDIEGYLPEIERVKSRLPPPASCPPAASRAAGSIFSPRPIAASLAGGGAATPATRGHVRGRSSINILPPRAVVKPERTIMRRRSMVPTATTDAPRGLVDPFKTTYPLHEESSEPKRDPPAVTNVGGGCMPVSTRIRDLDRAVAASIPNFDGPDTPTRGAKTCENRHVQRIQQAARHVKGHMRKKSKGRELMESQLEKFKEPRPGSDAGIASTRRAEGSENAPAVAPKAEEKRKSVFVRTTFRNAMLDFAALSPTSAPQVTPPPRRPAECTVASKPLAHRRSLTLTLSRGCLEDMLYSGAKDAKDAKDAGGFEGLDVEGAVPHLPTQSKLKLQMKAKSRSHSKHPSLTFIVRGFQAMET